MVLLEGMLYGLWSLYLGLPTGIGISMLVITMTKGFSQWQPPFMQVIIATVCAVVLCLLATLPPMRKLQKMSIVDGIRE